MSSDRSQYLSLFQKFGIIETLDDLNHVNEDEYQQTLTFLLSSQEEEQAPRPVSEATPSFDYALYQSTDEEIRNSCKTNTKNKINILRLLEDGREIANDWLLQYSTSICFAATPQENFTDNQVYNAPPEIVVPDIPAQNQPSQNENQDDFQYYQYQSNLGNGEQNPLAEDTYLNLENPFF